MKRIWMILFALTLVLLLAGCDDDDVGTAVNFLDALNQRDVTAAASYVCPERRDDIVGGLLTVIDPGAETFNFENVTCEGRGGDVLCRYTIDQVTGGADLTSETFSRQVTFEFEDGLICGFSEQVAE